jgi:hypothetical protein
MIKLLQAIGEWVLLRFRSRASLEPDPLAQPYMYMMLPCVVHQGHAYGSLCDNPPVELRKSDAICNAFRILDHNFVSRRTVSERDLELRPEFWNARV